MSESASRHGSHLWIKDIRENGRVSGAYLVRDKRVGTTRRGDPFISLILADRSGEMAGRVWEGAETLSPLFQTGDVVAVEGTASSYRGRTQITISDLKAVEGEVEPEIFLESTPGNVSKMLAEIREILTGVRNPHLRALIDRFLEDRRFVSGLKTAPAAKNFHHSYVGGLLEHTLSVCEMAVWAAGHYPQLDGDLLVTGAFLHDIGKMKELKANLQIEYTDEGRLLGHLVLGAAMVDEKLEQVKGFPHELALRLKHLILSHHGQYEFGSPKRPKFLEAFALHLMDDLDAKMNGLTRFMERDDEEGAWTQFNRLFDRYFMKGRPRDEELPLGPLKEGDEKQGRLFEG
jgi:3'-5' exoribonuclease